MNVINCYINRSRQINNILNGEYSLQVKHINFLEYDLNFSIPTPKLISIIKFEICI